MSAKKPATEKVCVADALSDITNRAFAAADLLDVIHEECAIDGRIRNAVFGVEVLVKSIADDLSAALKKAVETQ